MSPRTKAKLVGLFVIGAVALLGWAVVAMSSGRLFAQWRTWVVFLPGAASGLKPGAPVTMRGVQIGEVQDVDLFFLGPGHGHQVGIMVTLAVRRGSTSYILTACGLTPPWRRCVGRRSQCGL